MKRGAIVGFGLIAEGHAEGYGYNPSLQVVAIVDESRERRKAGVQRFPYAAAFQTIEEALAVADLDFVDICTPPSSHLGILTTCLDHNLFVICEKPLVCSYGDALHVMEKLKTGTGILYPAHNYRFAPAISRLASVVSSMVGEVRHATFEIHRVRHARGVVEWMPDWRRNAAVAGGGILLDHGPHSIYLASRIVGRLPTAVACVITRPTDGPFTDTEDVADLSLEFGPATSADIFLTWRADRRSTHYRFAGTDGEVALHNDTIEFIRDGRLESETVPSEFDDPRHGRWFAALLGDAYEFMTRQARPDDLVSEALGTMAVLDAAYRSAADGGSRVKI